MEAIKITAIESVIGARNSNFKMIHQTLIAHHSNHFILSDKRSVSMAPKIQVEKTTIRGCLLYDFLSGISARESSRRLCAAFGEGVVSVRTAQEWFARFRLDDMTLEDQPRSGRPPTIENEELRNLVETDPRQTTREMATRLGRSNSTVHEHLIAIGKQSKLGQWVPHKLTDLHKQRRAEIATCLLSRRRSTNWLTDIVTGDEKWVLYVNIKRRRQWVDVGAMPPATPKAGLHPKKVMLCVWWDAHGVIYWELLPPNTSLTAAYYCNQLRKLADEMRQKRPQRMRVLFLHDNARPHVAKITRETLLDLGWEILPHPAYSPDIAPSDFHLFRSLENGIRDKVFADEEEMKLWLADFFESKPPAFYSKGIESLPTRWQKVIDCDGDYPNF